MIYGRGGDKLDGKDVVSGGLGNKINCGEDADGQDVYTACIGSNDLVGGQQASTPVKPTGLSCEILFVEGIQIPQIQRPVGRC